MVTRTKITNTVKRCHPWLVVSSLLDMHDCWQYFQNSSDLARKRETQFVTTFLHQMLTAKLIKFSVNPYEMLHAPQLNGCHFNFRRRHLLVQRHGLAWGLRQTNTHTLLLLQSHKNTKQSHRSQITYLISSREMTVNLADAFNRVC